MPTTTGVLIFEGGRAEGRDRAEGARTSPGASSPAGLLSLVRRWTTLDTLDKFRATAGVDLVVLVTDSDELADEARATGAEVHRSDGGFHFGRTLATLVSTYFLDRVVYLGGGSVPLLGPAEIETLLEQTPVGERVFTANNVQSPDIVALGSARAAAGLELSPTDNATVLTLGDAGFRRRLLPDTTTAGFDLDTPTDVLFLAHEVRRLDRAPGPPDGSAGLGPRTAAGVRGLDLDFSLLERAAARG